MVYGEQAGELAAAVSAGMLKAEDALRIALATSARQSLPKCIMFRRNYRSIRLWTRSDGPRPICRSTIGSGVWKPVIKATLSSRPLRLSRQTFAWVEYFLGALHPFRLTQTVVNHPTNFNHPANFQQLGSCTLPASISSGTKSHLGTGNAFAFRPIRGTASGIGWKTVLGYRPRRTNRMRRNTSIQHAATGRRRTGRRRTGRRRTGAGNPVATPAAVK
jgi:hypothetical protein